MDLDDFRDYLGAIRKNYREFIFGSITGLAIGVLVSLVLLSLQIFLALANLILTAMILISLGKLKLPQLNPTVKSTKRNTCPECGSSSRHKKGCSRSKKMKLLHGDKEK